MVKKVRKKRMMNGKAKVSVKIQAVNILMRIKRLHLKLKVSNQRVKRRKMLSRNKRKRKKTMSLQTMIGVVTIAMMRTKKTAQVARTQQTPKKLKCCFSRSFRAKRTTW